MRTQTVRPVRNLSRRFPEPFWGKRLDSFELFSLLRKKELIVGVVYGESGQPTHYRETKKMTQLHDDEVRGILSEAVRGTLE